jgi:hypothetical protein
VLCVVVKLQIGKGSEDALPVELVILPAQIGCAVKTFARYQILFV